MSPQETKQIPDGQNQQPEEHLGIAGKMAKAFIHSPLSPLLFFAMLSMGILGLIFTPRQEDPQISVPMVDIMVNYAGASSEQVASLAIDPLERLMSEIPGVKHVYSASRHGNGIVTVQFIVGEQLGPSIVKVHDKIQSNLDKIPPGVSMPLVKPKGVDDVPAVTLTLWSNDVDDGVLRTLALDLLQSIKQVPNTGQGFIVGGRSEQVRVEVVPERLSGYGLSLDQVANTIRTANSESSAGSVESGNNYYTVNTGAFLRSAKDIERLVVATQGSTPIYVRDVANVFQAPEETGQIVQFYTGAAYKDDRVADAVPAVTIAIAKKEGTNGVTVANAVLEKVEALHGRIIPSNVNVDITRNYGETANDKVNELIFKLFIATGAVGLLIWYSLGIKPAIVVLIVIPVVILITVFSAWILGYTIDRVSLFALIFSIGILVDDAIVVVENIYRRWLEKGEMDTETAVDAVREVGNPTILATFTVIAALLPMGFVSGMMGPYMEPIPALGSVAMIFSLIAAFIFTPWLAMRIRPTMEQLEKAEVKEKESNERLERLFKRVLNPIIQNKRLGNLTLFVIIAAFFLSCVLFYTTAVTVKMLPLDNKPEFSVVIDMKEGTALPATANLASKMSDTLRKIPEVTALQTYVGVAQPYDFNGMVRHYYIRNEPWQGEIHVQLLHKSERDRSSHEIALEARKLLKPMADKVGGKITVVEMPPGPPVLQAIVAEIYGPDAKTRREVAHKVTQAFEDAPSVADVDNYMQEPYKTWRFNVDTEKAVRRGISVDTINRNLSMAMGGYKLGDIKQASVLDPTYIVIQIPLSIRAQVARLGDLPIPTADGKTIPLAELGRFEQVDQDPIIYHKDLRPIEYVVGEAVGRLAAPIYGMFEIQDRLNEYVTPDGVTMSGEYLGPPADTGMSSFEWTGEWTVTYETFRDMGAAFGVALILIYILVVWEFGNFVVPAVIMAPIPLTLIGIIPGHWLLNAEFTATSMIGFIALAGIIVRNSILLVDFSIQQVNKGMDVRDAVIQSCKTRTRPILITAFALVGGSSVILSDPIFQGMAISLLFGVLVSTLLTLMVIPLGCISARKVFCSATGPDSICIQPESDTIPKKSHRQGIKIVDIAIGLWRLVMMLVKSLLFKLYQYAVTAIFAAIEWFQSRKQKHTPQPTVNKSVSTPTQAGVDKTSTPAPTAVNLEAKVSADKKPESVTKTDVSQSTDTSRDTTDVSTKSDKYESKGVDLETATVVTPASTKADESKVAPAATTTKTAVKKIATRKTAVKKSTVKKSIVKKAADTKPAESEPVKKAPVKKTKTVKKSAVKKTPVKKVVVKQAEIVKNDEISGLPAESISIKKKSASIKKKVMTQPSSKKSRSVAIKKKSVTKGSRRGIRLKSEIDDDFDI